MGWSAAHYVPSGTSSVSGVIIPAGPERAVGVVSSTYLKDANGPAWAGDAGVEEYRRFMARHLPNADAGDFYYLYGYTVSQALRRVLEQCGGDFRRERIMREAANLRDLEIPTLLPGVRVNTSPTDYRPLRQLQLIRWDGRTWRRFGPLIDGVA